MLEVLLAFMFIPFLLLPKSILAALLRLPLFEADCFPLGFGCLMLKFEGLLRFCSPK